MQVICNRLILEYGEMYVPSDLNGTLDVESSASLESIPLTANSDKVTSLVYTNVHFFKASNP